MGSRLWKALGAAVLVLSACSASAYPYSGGTGTSGDPYQIATVADWEELTETSADWVAGKYFILTADIDFTGAPQESIGRSPNRFKGSFDGDNHTITRIAISTCDATNATAIFAGCGAGAVVKDLTVEDAVITGIEIDAGLSGYCAVIVGENSGYTNPSTAAALVSNCHVINGSITYTHGGTTYGMAGMIVGANHGYVEGCSASGTLTFASPTGYRIDIGGITGYQRGTDAPGHTIDSTSTVNIRCNSEIGAMANVGGIVGNVSIVDGHVSYLADSTYNGTMSVTNPVAADFTHTGGIVGYTSSKVYNCSAQGTITVATAEVSASGGRNRSGGGIGYAVAGADIDSCWSDIALSVNYGNNATVGGFIGYLNGAGSIDDCYCKGTLVDLKTNGALTFTSSGSFAGMQVTGTITGCWSALTGPITLAGGNYSFACFYSGTSTSCYWDKTTSGVTATNTGATGKTTAEMKVLSTFTGWDFLGDSGGMADTWRMCVNGVDYPHLTWEYVKNGDFACPDGVAFDDLSRLASNWLLTYSTLLHGADATGDSKVTFADFAILAGNWMQGS